MITLVMLSAANPAAADQDGAKAVAVLLGMNSAFDGDPATLRLTVNGEGDLARFGVAALALAVPVTWMTAGEERFGVSVRESVFEIPATLRLRLIPELPVRPYGDLGLGVAVAATSEDGWLFDSREQTAGWMTRSALGVEIGATDGLMVYVEPIALHTYWLGGPSARVGGMVGVGTRF